LIWIKEKNNQKNIIQKKNNLKNYKKLKIKLLLVVTQEKSILEPLGQNIIIKYIVGLLQKLNFIMKQVLILVIRNY
jgi:hypothetical protein